MQFNCSNFFFDTYFHIPWLNLLMINNNNNMSCNAFDYAHKYHRYTTVFYEHIEYVFIFLAKNVVQ